MVAESAINRMFEQWWFPLTARALSCNAAANQRWKKVLGSIMKKPWNQRTARKSGVVSDLQVRRQASLPIS